MRDHYRMLAAYNAWANRILYEEVGKLDDAAYRRNLGAFFGSLHRTLNHLLTADRIWMKRFTGAGDARPIVPNRHRASTPDIRHGAAADAAHRMLGAGLSTSRPEMLTPFPEPSSLIARPGAAEAAPTKQMPLQAPSGAPERPQVQAALFRSAGLLAWAAADSRTLSSPAIRPPRSSSISP